MSAIRYIVKSFLVMLSAVLMSCNGGSSTSPVTGAALQTITISTTTTVAPLGTTPQFSAIGNYSDGSTQNLTDQVVWSSASPTVATISNNTNSMGLVTTTAAGSTIITAMLNTITSAPVSLTVNSAVLLSIQVTAPSISSPLSISQQYTAKGTYSDKSLVDITTSVTWSSSSIGVAAISNASSSQGLMTPMAVGSAGISATLGEVSSNLYPLAVTAAVLTEIKISAAKYSTPLGLNQQFSALGSFSDGTKVNITSSVNWSSSSSSIAIISDSTGSNGLLTPLSVGSSLISASLAGVSSNQVSVTVEDATLQSIKVSATTMSAPLGYNQQFTADGFYSNGTKHDMSAQVSWSSSNSGVLTISPKGLGTPVTVGTSRVTASLQGISGVSSLYSVTNATLTAIVISASSLSIHLGMTQQMLALGSYSDGSQLDITSSVTWSSSNGDVSISNAAASNGLATATGVGGSLINAATASGTKVSNSLNLIVSPAQLETLLIFAPADTVAIGSVLPFMATAVYSDGNEVITDQVSWSSSNDSAATISNLAPNNGVLTPLLAGENTTVSASFNGVSSVNELIMVSPATLNSISIDPVAFPSTALGLTKQYIATGHYSDHSTADISSLVGWASNQSDIATISNTPGSNGLVTPVAIGTTAISATLGAINSSPSTFTVSAAVLKSVHIVDNNLSAPVGLARQLTADAVYSSGKPQPITTSAMWISSNPAVATINSATGYVKPVSAGTTIIRVTFDGVVSAPVQFVVSAASLTSISITHKKTSPVGAIQHYKAIGKYSNESKLDITSAVVWLSSNQTVAIASNFAGKNGQVIPIAVGTTAISASLTGVASNALSLNVTPAVLTSISVTASQPFTPVGETTQLTANGTYSDGSIINLTKQVQWTSSNIQVATVNSSNGLLSGLNVGTSNITASYLTKVSSPVSISVSGAALTSISIQIPYQTTGIGVAQKLGAIGNYSDGSSLDLTDAVSWSSSVGNVVSVGNASNSSQVAGLASSLASGSATITAAYLKIAATSEIQVTSATLSSLAIVSTISTLPRGTQAILSLTGVYSDSSTYLMSSAVTWTSSNSGVISVTNLSATNPIGGVVTALESSGQATITAALASVTSNPLQLTVSPSVLDYIVVDPLLVSLPVGLTQQYTAIGHYSGGENINISAAPGITWSSTKPSSVAINGTGLAAAIQPNAIALITATLGGVQSEAVQLTSESREIVSLQMIAPPAPVSFGYGLPATQIKAMAQFSDDSNGDVTNLVNWSSSNPSVLTVGNTASSKGQVTAVSQTGAAIITAALPGKTAVAPATLSATATELASIAVTNPLTNLEVNGTLQLVAVGTFANGTTATITDLVSWTSLTTSVVAFTTPDTPGLVTGVSMGVGSVQASYQNESSPAVPLVVEGL